MSIEEKNNEELQLIRISLTKSVFEKYHDLIAAIKTLPLPPNLSGLNKAILDIDTGMLWIKELLTCSPLIIPKEENKIIDELPIS